MLTKVVKELEDILSFNKILIIENKDNQHAVELLEVESAAIEFALMLIEQEVR